MRRRATVFRFRISSELPGPDRAPRLEIRSSATFRQLHVALAERLGASLEFAEFVVKESPIGDRVVLTNPSEFVPRGPDDKPMGRVRLDEHFKAPGDHATYYPHPGTLDRYEILLEAIALPNRGRRSPTRRRGAFDATGTRRR